MNRRYTFVLAVVLLLNGTHSAFAYRETKAKTTAIQLNQLEVNLEDFKIACGFYPMTEQGLEALTKEPATPPRCKKYGAEGFLRNVPLDGWDQPFKYTSNGANYKIEASHGYFITNNSPGHQWENSLGDSPDNKYLPFHSRDGYCSFWFGVVLLFLAVVMKILKIGPKVLFPILVAGAFLLLLIGFLDKIMMID